MTMDDGQRPVTIAHPEHFVLRWAKKLKLKKNMNGWWILQYYEKNKEFEKIIIMLSSYQHNPYWQGLLEGQHYFILVFLFCLLFKDISCATLT